MQGFRRPVEARDSAVFFWAVWSAAKLLVLELDLDLEAAKLLDRHFEQHVFFCAGSDR